MEVNIFLFLLDNFFGEIHNKRKAKDVLPMTIQPLETACLHLVPSSLSLAPMVTAHYIKNREHLRPTSPLRSEDFFTLSRQTEGLMEDVRQQEAGSSVRFWLFPKEAPQTIAGMVHLSQISRGVFLSCSSLVFWATIWTRISYGRGI